MKLRTVHVKSSRHTSTRQEVLQMLIEELELKLLRVWNSFDVRKVASSLLLPSTLDFSKLQIRIPVDQFVSTVQRRGPSNLLKNLLSSFTRGFFFFYSVKLSYVGIAHDSPLLLRTNPGATCIYNTTR